jgi:hypothetical protein
MYPPLVLPARASHAEVFLALIDAPAPAFRFSEDSL